MADPGEQSAPSTPRDRGGDPGHPHVSDGLGPLPGTDLEVLAIPNATDTPWAGVRGAAARGTTGPACGARRPGCDGRIEGMPVMVEPVE